MTPDSEASEWVEREILLAMDEGKPVFPVLLQGKVFPILINKQYVDVREGKLPPESFYRQLPRPSLVSLGSPSIAQNNSEPPVKIDLQDLLMNVIVTTNMSPLIEIRWSYHHGLDFTVECLKTPLEQVFRVLVLNAKSAMRNEGILDLRFRDIKQNNVSAVEILISDTGPGIPEEIASSLFTAKVSAGTHKGVGFGLFWASTFIKFIGGNLNLVTSKKETGTTIQALIPRALPREYPG
jgi:signal transduction histidine kinase